MIEYIILGAIGGLSNNIIQLLEACKKSKKDRPDFKDKLYWASYLFYPFIGGLLVYVYNGPNLVINKTLAFHIGLSAPLILRQLVQSAPIVSKEIPLTDDNQ